MFICVRAKVGQDDAGEVLLGIRREGKTAALHQARSGTEAGRTLADGGEVSKQQGQPTPSTHHTLTRT